VRRRTCAAVVLVAFSAAAGCGGEAGERASGARTTAGDPFEEVSRQPRLTRTARRAAPRWERVARFEGIAPAAHPLKIAGGAIQWRARWRCSTGQIALAVAPAPRTAADKPGGRCPGSGETTWVQTGDQRLRVSGGGRWSVVVEQQVDTPLREPALPAMRAAGARLIKSGRFYPVERQGRGSAHLYRLADGRGALRLDAFRTSSNTDLFVWLSAAARPRTTKQAVEARRLGRLIALKSTIGEHNYVLPRGVDPRKVRSIVIWCVPIQIVYTAAALR
jgi:hypothetical protein